MAKDHAERFSDRAQAALAAADVLSEYYMVARGETYITITLTKQVRRTRGQAAQNAVRAALCTLVQLYTEDRTMKAVGKKWGSLNLSFLNEPTPFSAVLIPAGLVRLMERFGIPKKGQKGG